jgi:hypothetical protein
MPRRIYNRPMPSLEYKPNYPEVLERLHAFYDRRYGDRILATMQVPSPAIEDFKASYPTSQCEYPDPETRAEFWDRFLYERISVEDDSMPVAYLSEFDQGLYGGMLGGEVRFMAHPDNGWISSMVPPLLRDWSGFDRLQFNEANPWWQRYLTQLRVFAERSRGKWGVSHFILIDALNFVFELIGATATYLSVEEEPDLVRRAIDLAFDLNVRAQRTFFETIGLFERGTFSNFAQWMPGRIVSESLDPFHMTSVAYFEKWGREPAERILGTFDGGVIHIHGNGRHLLPAASSIRGLRAILLLDDTGFPAAFDVIAELKRRMGDMPTAVHAEYEPFVERLERHALPGGVLYKVNDVPDIDAANRLMEKVRAYRVSSTPTRRGC